MNSENTKRIPKDKLEKILQFYKEWTNNQDKDSSDTKIVGVIVELAKECLELHEQLRLTNIDYVNLMVEATDNLDQIIKDIDNLIGSVYKDNLANVSQLEELKKKVNEKLDKLGGIN